jgi:hypothetical protein
MLPLSSFGGCQGGLVSLILGVELGDYHIFCVVCVCVCVCVVSTWRSTIPTHCHEGKPHGQAQADAQS